MFELEILPREKTGTKASKRYRKEGFVPVEIYGRGEENIHGLVRKSDLLKILHKTHGELLFDKAEALYEQFGKGAFKRPDTRK